MSSKAQMSKRDRAEREAAHRLAAQRARQRREHDAQFRRVEMTDELADAIRNARRAVERAHVVEANAEKRIDFAVLRLRSLGCTWQQIGAALNVSSEGARKRHEAASKRRTTWVVNESQS